MRMVKTRNPDMNAPVFCEECGIAYAQGWDMPPVCETFHSGHWCGTPCPCEGDEYDYEPHELAAMRKE